MIEYAKVILWGVSFWESLFRKELLKIVSWSNNEELAELRKYCYDKYSDMYPHVLDEVFATGKLGVSEPVVNQYVHRGAHSYTVD